MRNYSIIVFFIERLLEYLINYY